MMVSNIWLVSAASLVVACVYEPNTSSESLQISTSIPRPSEEPLLELSATVDGFAGYYCADGKMVALLAPVTAVGVEQLESGIDLRTRPACRTRTAPKVGVALEVAAAKYSFRQLRSWRDSVADEYFAIDGVSSLSIDYRANKIILGATTNNSTVNNLLAVHGVPQDAYEVVYEGQLVPQACANPSNGPTLRDCFRPIPGGVQIDETLSGGVFGFGACSTAGANDRLMVEYNPAFWQSGFLTASHCTSNQWANNSDWIWQKNVDSPVFQQRVGFEFRDPPGYACGSNICRSSDAAWIWADNAAVQHGTIARTTWYNGSTTIDSSNPRFLIVGWLGSVQGMEVEKVGRTTGWTTGTVTSVCVDALNGNLRLTCQSRANYASDGGDSGGAVFKWWYWDGSKAEIVGIHTGVITATGIASYSPMENVLYDMGDLYLAYPYF